MDGLDQFMYVEQDFVWKQNMEINFIKKILCSIFIDVAKVLCDCTDLDIVFHEHAPQTLLGSE